MKLDIKFEKKVLKSNKDFIIFGGMIDKKNVLPKDLPQTIEKFILDFVKNKKDICAKGKESFLYFNVDKVVYRIIFCGLGELSKFENEDSRMSGGALAKTIAKESIDKAMLFFPINNIKNPYDFWKSFFEGLYMGSYKFDEYKSKKESKNQKNTLLIYIKDEKTLKEAQAVNEQSYIIAKALNFSRDLVNSPSNIVTPSFLADKAKKIAKDDNIAFKVLEEEDMTALGMGALLSVSKGSVLPPKMIVMEYNGAPKDKDKIALVGKGVTFDSGGISLKPSAGMDEMKEDMSGAASVISSLSAIAKLKLPVNVVGVIPCVENMPSGIASRPGDIVKSASGKTIEIISTDAEGRMILADAVWYADKKLDATYIVDIATLTGAVSIALGETVSALITNNQKLCDKILKASNKSGDKCWQLPSYDEFKEYNKSDVADIKNSGGRYGGTITGGLFIGAFTEKPWVHIDIGNTASTKSSKGYNVKGATGVGVRLFVEFISKMSHVS